MNRIFEKIGIRGSGTDAEKRRERAANLKAMMESLDAMMPTKPFAPFLSPQDIRIAGTVAPDDKLLALVHDTIRKRHMGVLVELYVWEPGMPTDALVAAAGRVKELVELCKSLEEIVEEAGKEKK